MVHRSKTILGEMLLKTFVSRSWRQDLLSERFSTSILNFKNRCAIRTWTSYQFLRQYQLVVKINNALRPALAEWTTCSVESSEADMVYFDVPLRKKLELSFENQTCLCRRSLMQFFFRDNCLADCLHPALVQLLAICSLSLPVGIVWYSLSWEIFGVRNQTTFYL